MLSRSQQSLNLVAQRNHKIRRDIILILPVNVFQRRPQALLRLCSVWKLLGCDHVTNDCKKHIPHLLLFYYTVPVLYIKCFCLIFKKSNVFI